MYETWNNGIWNNGERGYIFKLANVAETAKSPFFPSPVFGKQSCVKRRKVTIVYHVAFVTQQAADRHGVEILQMCAFSDWWL